MADRRIVRIGELIHVQAEPAGIVRIDFAGARLARPVSRKGVEKYKTNPSSVVAMPVI